MDQKIVYSKTGKGVLEIKSNARKLSRELAKVLSQVDGKSAVADLGAKSKLNEANLARCLKQLEEEGYIKEFAGLSSGMKSFASAGAASSYVDDLDFTSALSPGKAVYSNAQTEFRASESADRKRAEEEATRKRKAKEEQKRQEAKIQARKEVARMARVEAERKAKEAAAIKVRKQAELDEKRMAAEMVKTTRDLAEILEVERRALEKTDGRRPAAKTTRSGGSGGSKGIDVDLRKREEEILRRYQEEQGRKQNPKAAKPGAPTTVANEEEDRHKREEEERRKREEEEKRKREEEEKRKREEEEKRKREEEEKRKREEEEKRKREEEEKRKREEEEKRKREEEEKRKREEEEKRKREEEEKRKREEEEKRKREEEEKRKREEEEKRQREEEERRKREVEERLRREEEDRRREEEDRRREEEERRRREEEEQRKREEEEQRKRETQERRKQEMAEFRKQQKAELERLEKEKRERDQENLDVPAFDINTFEAMTGSDSAGEDSSANLEFPSLSPESDDAFSLDFDKQQEELAKQAAEEERRIHEAEEARLTMERAAREEEARAEAERRSAIEAEMRARVEQEKEERAERENHKREEYKRKIQETEDRKRAAQEKKLQEEQQQIEADRKRRENDLIRRREEAEEAGRKARELKALKRSGKVRSPVERVVAMATGVIVILAMAVGVLHVMPMSGYVPTLERLASNNIGEPVSIGALKVSLLSGLQFKLSNVSVGSTQDVILNDVVVTPKLGSIFGDQLVLTSIEANGGKIVKEALSRLPLWQDSSALDTRMHVQSIALRGITPEMRAFKLPSVNVDVKFGQIGQVRSARIETTNGKLYATITSGDSSGKGVTIGASDWTPPFGTPIVITDFLGTGTFTGSALNLSEWDATLYGGQAKGTARISWNSGWRATSQFEFVRIVTEDLLAAFTKTAKASGKASGKAAFSARSGSLHTLLDNPTLQASFLVKKGNLDGVDLVRALQVGSAGSQGGSTKFQELSGDVTISNGRFSYKNVNLNAGILSASSSFNIATNQAVSGRVTVALRSSAQRLTANLNVTGSLKGVLLRP